MNTSPSISPDFICEVASGWRAIASFDFAIAIPIERAPRAAARPTQIAADIIRKAEARAEEIKKRAEEEAKEELSDVIAKAAKEKIEKACSVDGFLSENMKNDG